VNMMADIGGIVSRPEGSMGMRDSCRSNDLRVGPEGSCSPGAGEEGAGRGRRSVPAKTPARRTGGCEGRVPASVPAPGRRRWAGCG
jgi:hypothetical protein